MNNTATAIDVKDGNESGLEGVLKGYELNPFRQVEICVMEKLWPQGSEKNNKAVIGECVFPGNYVVADGAVSN